MPMKRRAEIRRETSETRIRLALTLDPDPNRPPDVRVSTGMGFADHMITLMAFWAHMELDLSCEGDLHVDGHHTLEDVGLCLGRAMDEALGDKKGIARVGWARVPMDEAMCDVALDLSGRPYLVYMEDAPLPPTIAGEEKDLWREYYKSLATAARMNLHMRFLYGQNGHHLLESAAKGLGLALRAAWSPQRAGLLSTKGSLD